MYVSIFNIICLLLFCPCSQSKGVCSELIYRMNLIQCEVVVTDKNKQTDTGSNLRPNARYRPIADVKPTQPSTTTEDKEISTVYVQLLFMYNKRIWYRNIYFYMWDVIILVIKYADQWKHCDVEYVYHMKILIPSVLKFLKYSRT